jgi:hypothetical protein
MYDLVDILKPNIPNPGAGGGLKSFIFAAKVSDVEVMPARGTDLVTIANPLVMKTGKYVHLIYATNQTIQPKETKLNGDNKDAGGVEITVDFHYPGVTKEIQEFKAKFMNEEFYFFLMNCAASMTYLIGEPCNPAWIESWETTWGKTVAEGKGTTFTLKSQQSLPMAIYTSDIEDLLDQASGSTSVSPSGV